MSHSPIGGSLIQVGTYNYFAAPEASALWINVPPMPGTFVGRDALVTELVQQLTSGQSVALSAEGLPGVGKTTLAVTIAWHPIIREYFKDGVLWAGLGLNADVASIQATWAEALKVDISSLQGEAVTQAIRNAVGQRAFLLVLDDVWEQSAAEALRCGGPHCCHLLTTRDKAIARSFAGPSHAVSVPTLEGDDAYQLLEELAAEACEADPDAARALVRAVGGLPLALELVGSYLAAPERTLFPDLSQAALNEMSDPQHRLQLAQRRLGGPDVKVTLQQVIELSLEGLRESEVGREAERAFYALGAFAPKPESFDRAAALHVAQSDDRILALLVARNLLEKASGESLALHQTLADVARTRLDDAARARHRAYYLALVNEDREDWRRIEQAYGQIKWAWKGVDGKKVLQWVWALRIYQERRGLWRDYLEWAKRGLELAQEKVQRDDESRLLNNIGGTYHGLGQPQEALNYYKHALTIREKIGDRAGQATTLNNIGEVFLQLGVPLQALRYFERALPIMEEVGDRAGLATTLNNIGGVNDSLGRPQQALGYYKQALPIWKEGNDRTGLATTLANIAGVHYRLSQPQEALNYYKHALTIQEEIGNRAGQATILNNFGVVYDDLGQPQQALDYFERALTIREEVGDRAGESVTRYNMAMIYRKKMRLLEAVAELKRVVELDLIVQSPYLDHYLKMLAQVEAELKAQEEGGS